MPTTTDIVEETELAKVDPNAINILEETKESIAPATIGGFFGFSTPSAAMDKIKMTTAKIGTIKMPTMPTMPTMKIGGAVAEDRRMTGEAFNLLINQMVPLTAGNLCPQSGTTVNPFNNNLMPDLSCPGAKFGGRRRTRRYKKNKKSRKSKKRRSK
jgi:hypothetical protein